MSARLHFLTCAADQPDCHLRGSALWGRMVLCHFHSPPCNPALLHWFSAFGLLSPVPAYALVRSVGHRGPGHWEWGVGRCWWEAGFRVLRREARQAGNHRGRRCSPAMSQGDPSPLGRWRRPIPSHSRIGPFHNSEWRQTPERGSGVPFLIWSCLSSNSHSAPS